MPDHDHRNAPPRPEGTEEARASALEHGHGHEHGHDTVLLDHGVPLPCPVRTRAGRVLTIRAHSGLSGDMMLAGLTRMLGLDNAALGELAGRLMPELAGSARVERAAVNGIGGWHAVVDLPRQHAHRALGDILGILDNAGISGTARGYARETFMLLAQAEGRVHGLPPSEVRFHEVGALDSILDIGLVCELFVLLAPDACVVSPLPLADGAVTCAHGVLGVPAPAVLELLPGIPVRPFAGSGETVTPTAAALLKSLPVSFGPWPAMTVGAVALVFGGRRFQGAPNGAIFALGQGPVPADGARP